MRTHFGDIWLLYPEHFIVIPTNLGWDREGLNVMGAGLAKQAANRFPEIKKRYGELCREGEHGLIIFYDLRLIMFPTKELNPQQPWLSWRNPSNFALVEKNVRDLAHLPARPIAVPLVGCGHGGLNQKKVTSLLTAYLEDDKFTLVFPQ